MEDKIKELSYEEDQIQMVILKELEQSRLEEERKIKQTQDNEYKECLFEDREKESQKNSQTKKEDQNGIRNGEKTSKEPIFDEPSIEEMRRVRLARFKG